jgi:hypothetical protein
MKPIAQASLLYLIHHVNRIVKAKECVQGNSRQNFRRTGVPFVPTFEVLAT